MSEVKVAVQTSIARAQAELNQAMADLEHLPSVSPDASAFAAHALSNYLAVIGATVELMSLRLGRRVDPQVRVWLDGLSHATSLMGRTVSQLLESPASADAKLRFEAVDLPVVLQRILFYYGRLAGPKHIKLTAPPDGHHPPVWTDRVVLYAVLDNLFSNAVKFSPPRSTVSIELKSDADHVVFGVRDEGPGLSSADQSRLFQRGVRLTPEPTGGEPSFGYGLAVAKQLCSRLGVELWCESEVGRGCVFCLKLPVFTDHHRAGG